jgi:acetyl-CoA C-acetyltransferase
MSDPIVIVSAARTPMGGFQGDFASLSCAQLGSVAIKAAVERAGLKPEQVDEVIMGCVLPAGQGQAPARQASLGAGLPLAAGCTTVNKMCGSGMRAAMYAHDMLLAGSVDVMVAGGMESMTNAPYLLPKARGGFRLGHGEVKDHMFLDGLEDAYDKGRLMGTFAEDCAGSYKFTREAQDAFAIASTTRSKQANTDGSFAWEIAPVTVSGTQGRRGDRQGRAALQGATSKRSRPQAGLPQGRHGNAANSSSISDGAAALVMMRASTAAKLGLKPHRHRGRPQHLRPGTGPVHHGPGGRHEEAAGEERLERTDSVDLWEINEAFAVVTMAAMHDLNLPHEKVNVHGGACALGHPIGASGARVIVTLIGALRKHGKKRGVASLCIGGGEATAVGIELA